MSVKTFKDGSRAIVEQIGNRTILHIRLGFNLNFIDKIVLTDGTIIQNMQYELSAKVPESPVDILLKLKEHDDTSDLTRKFKEVAMAKAL